MAVSSLREPKSNCLQSVNKEEELVPVNFSIQKKKHLGHHVCNKESVKWWQSELGTLVNKQVCISQKKKKNYNKMFLFIVT